MKTLLAFSRDWLPYLAVLAVGTAILVLTGRPASAEEPTNLDHPACQDAYEDPAYYYCWENIWGYETDYRMPAVEVVDSGVYGFTMYAEEPFPEPNVHALILFEYGHYHLTGDVGGAQFSIELIGTCDYQVLFDWREQCGYWPVGIQLGEGWMLDNGIDLSGTYIEAEETLFPPFVGGAGADRAPYPYDPENPPLVGLSHVHTEDVYDFPVEDYFGITVRLHTGDHSDVGDVAAVPEPGMPVALGAGMAALGLIASRRRH